MKLVRVHESVVWRGRTAAREEAARPRAEMMVVDLENMLPGEWCWKRRETRDYYLDLEDTFD